MEKNLKLFGMEILLPHEQHDSGEEDSPVSSIDKPRSIDKGDATENGLEVEKCQSIYSSSCDSEIVPKSPIQDQSKDENDEKIPKTKLKKPDKILPCPRCNSSDTKFCYYNNYNINQPRHFCRSCQRYWTAGGTMRNVPVGAGRRKSKNSSHCHHIAVSQALLGDCKGFECLKTDSNTTLLSFGSENVRKQEDQRKSCANIFQAAPVMVPGFGQGMPWNVPVIPIPISWPVKTQNLNVSGIGKHSRNGELKSPVLVPKTLRIDDPEAAAKSTIWTTLGINQDLINRKSLFQGFQPKTGLKTAASISPALLANPSALSRSNFFREAA